MPRPRSRAPIQAFVSAMIFGALVLTEVRTASTPIKYDFDRVAPGSPAPRYPPSSLRYAESGATTLAVLINDQGRAEKVEIKESSGYQRLDAAAMEAVADWQFIAPQSPDQAMAGWITLRINFVLNPAVRAQ